MKDVKFNLKQAREYRKLSQDQVAKALGVAKTSYQYYEKGNREMRVSTAKKFCKLVDIPMEDIIF